MNPKIGVGIESTLDIVITFPELNELEKFAHNYDGELAPHVRKGYEIIKSGSGGEVPIDGKKEEAAKLLELAKEEADIRYNLGGNGAQEAVTLKRLGAEAVFLGGIFPSSLSKLSGSQKKVLEETDTKFAQAFDEYAPASYILQAYGTNRYILTEGEGRRIKQLKSYLRNLPDTLRKVKEAYGDLDALSLVGWQVLFANELKEDDFQLVTSVLEEIREVTDSILFTDSGGIGNLDEVEKERLYDIYALFDLLSMNEDELFCLSKVMGCEEDGEVEILLKLLEETDELSSAWLHTPDYQITLSTDFSRKVLNEAQDVSAIAGIHKVETGDYPTMEDISQIRKTHNFSEKGLKKKESISNKYGKKVQGYDLVCTPCYEEEDFVSTVGAGDVSSAGYLYSIA